MKKKAPLLVIVLLLTLHLPFLFSDPDTNISFSRDAFTDEGLYTSQVRNYLLTGDFRLDESDAAVKTPLFSGFMLLLFSLTGIHLVAARIAVLLISMSACYFISRKDQFLSLILPVLVMMQYSIFHYSHIALSEMLSVSCLALGWFFMTRDSGNKFSIWNTGIVCFTIAMAWWFKFQYLYMVIWPLIFYVLAGIYFSLTDAFLANRAFRNVLVSCLVILVLFAVYAIAWYLPSRNLFDYVMRAQALAPFGEGEWFRKMIYFNIENYFLNDSAKAFTVLFLILMAFSPLVLYQNRSDIKWMMQFIGAFAWCLLEVYKPALAYLPGRYLVSTFFAMGLFSCVVLKGILLPGIRWKFKKSAVIVLITIPVVVNLVQYYNAYQRRTDIIQQANNFVASHCPHGCNVAGPWAASITWKSGSPTIPVWKDYFNDKNTMEKFHPCVIVSELDEEDSGSSWSAQGVHLSEMADTTYDFKIHNWHSRIYVLKSAIKNTIPAHGD